MLRTRHKRLGLVDHKTSTESGVGVQAVLPSPGAGLRVFSVGIHDMWSAVLRLMVDSRQETPASLLQSEELGWY